MNPAARLVMTCALLSLCSCGTQIPGLPHITWWPEGLGEEVKATVDVPKKDGTTVKRRVSYHISPNRSGATRATAVRIVADNMLSGDLAEMHVLATRFPKATSRPYEVDPYIIFHIYHVYRVTESNGRTREFWFDASDYHGFF
ncbi:MAG TPA: hypothetical protein PLB55_20210 [Prosthecobacter sp.]|nr:hypothetical protein [Prosthecobacter sp.]